MTDENEKGGDKKTLLFLDFRPGPDCSNPDTYGEICVKCNECGRFNKKGDL